MTMIIKVEISNETWARLLTGKRIEGTLGYDLMTGRKDSNMFHRQTRSRLRDRLIKKLPWGWVKESQERYKTYSSVPKDMPLEALVRALGEDHDEAVQTIVDVELIERA